MQRLSVLHSAGIRSARRQRCSRSEYDSRNHIFRHQFQSKHDPEEHRCRHDLQHDLSQRRSPRKHQCTCGHPRRNRNRICWGFRGIRQLRYPAQSVRLECSFLHLPGWKQGRRGFWYFSESGRHLRIRDRLNRFPRLQRRIERRAAGSRRK